MFLYLMKVQLFILRKMTRSSSSEAKKLNFLLYGINSVNYDINCDLFREVQTFIINTNRFSMPTI